MFKSFNYPEQGGELYALSEEQKINKFECVMKESVYIS